VSRSVFFSLSLLTIYLFAYIKFIKKAVLPQFYGGTTSAFILILFTKSHESSVYFYALIYLTQLKKKKTPKKDRVLLFNQG